MAYVDEFKRLIGQQVRVDANDYTYIGHCVSVFEKRSKHVRCVVEDSCGRLFIHNLNQVTVRPPVINLKEPC